MYGAPAGKTVHLANDLHVIERIHLRLVSTRNGLAGIDLAAPAETDYEIAALVARPLLIPTRTTSTVGSLARKSRILHARVG